ncbi:MAG: 6-bladed beta-propeller [Verrucomicrobiota bacterium]|jgi:DNA-binding beta-propeller fold protein YncE
MKNMNQCRLLVLFGACLVVGLAGGCATKTAAPKAYTFFPPSPDEPRIQFLTAFNSDTDLGRGHSFADYITGVKTTTDPLTKPYGLAAYGGKVFVCDTVADKIEVFDFQKHRAFYFEPQGEGKLRLPINITIDHDGTRYVADTGRAQVLIYSPDGTFVEAMGKKDEIKPSDVALSADRIYIADLLNHCVKVYNKAGHNFLFSIPVDSQGKEGKLLSPTNLALDQPHNRLLVSDTGGNTVQVYDLEGKYLRSIGHAGVAPGMFARPKGVAVDRQGIAYVVDAATQVVQLFDTEGRLLMFFAEPGASTQGEVVLPAVVKVDYDNVGYFQKFVAPGHQLDYLIFVTSQFGSQKVSVYGFLKQPQP